MKRSHVIGISFLSSLTTLAVVFILMLANGPVQAQQPEPPLPDPNLAEPMAPAEAITADETDEASGPQAATAATRYLHVAGSVFVPMYSTTGETYSGPGCTYPTGTSPWYNYSLVLPYDATVTGLRLYYKDSNASRDGTLYLARYNDGIDYSYLATVKTSGSSGSATSSSVTGLNIDIDYINYSYVLYWLPGGSDSTIKLCGARVTYTTPSIFALAMPGIRQNWKP